MSEYLDELKISKKKQEEFDNIFKYIGEGNFFIDINLYRNLFESDFYEHFLNYIYFKLKEIIKSTNIIILHTNINSLKINDTYYYDKIIKLSKVLRNYSLNIKKIIVYGSSSLFINFIKIINISLNINISEKIYFANNDYEIEKKNNILTKKY